MEHLFLFRSQVHELKMRQMVEEINLGRHTIESVMAKYQVLPPRQEVFVSGDQIADFKEWLGK